MRHFACLLAFILAPTAAATELCDAPPNHEFDFWLGEWEITQRIMGAEGSVIELPAHTSVTRAAGGCALVERWTGQVQFPWAGMKEPVPMEGLSIRYFHQQEKRWFIHWLDSRNVSFGNPFVGGFENGVGIFTLTRDTPDGPRGSRITFRNPGRDHVLWSLTIETEKNEWHIIWTMGMRRIEKN